MRGFCFNLTLNPSPSRLRKALRRSKGGEGLKHHLLNMKSVLFVCLGNICRSPMAEGILRNMAEQAGVKMLIDSAGTGNWHAGEPPDERATQTAGKRGVDISKLRARQIKKDDFTKFDLILVADAEVYRDVKRMAGTHSGKVEFIMNLAYPGSNKPVPDPYTGGMDGFEKVFDMLDEACEAVIRKYGK